MRMPQLWPRSPQTLYELASAEIATAYADAKAAAGNGKEKNT